MEEFQENSLFSFLLHTGLPRDSANHIHTLLASHGCQTPDDLGLLSEDDLCKVIGIHQIVYRKKILQAVRNYQTIYNHNPPDHSPTTHTHRVSQNDTYFSQGNATVKVKDIFSWGFVQIYL